MDEILPFQKSKLGEEGKINLLLLNSFSLQLSQENFFTNQQMKRWSGYYLPQAKVS